MMGVESRFARFTVTFNTMERNKMHSFILIYGYFKTIVTFFDNTAYTDCRNNAMYVCLQFFSHL